MKMTAARRRIMLVGARRSEIPLVRVGSTQQIDVVRRRQSCVTMDWLNADFEG
jgi:hypothetical protein